VEGEVPKNLLKEKLRSKELRNQEAWKNSV